MDAAPPTNHMITTSGHPHMRALDVLFQSVSRMQHAVRHMLVNLVFRHSTGGCVFGIAGGLFSKRRPSGMRCHERVHAGLRTVDAARHGACVLLVITDTRCACELTLHPDREGAIPLLDAPVRIRGFVIGLALRSRTVHNRRGKFCAHGAFQNSWYGTNPHASSSSARID